MTKIEFVDAVAKERAERQARNPQTGTAIMVPACKVPKFKPAKALKELINA